MARGRPPGGAKYGGRAKGTGNRQTSELKDMILAALDKAGGEKYLMEQAKANPPAFMQLVSKVLPKDINSTVVIKNEWTEADEQRLLYLSRKMIDESKSAIIDGGIRAH